MSKDWKIDHDGKEYSAGWSRREAEKVNKTMFRDEGVVSEGSQSRGCALPFALIVTGASAILLGATWLAA